MAAWLTTWNHGLYTLFGYEDESVKAHGWWVEHIHPEYKDRVIKSITAHFICDLNHKEALYIMILGI